MNEDGFKKLLENALDLIKKTQKGHGKTLKSLISSATVIEKTQKEHSETLEDNAGVKAPPELTLLKVQ